MIFDNLSEELNNLQNLLHQLTAEQYNLKIEYLGNASIGGHTRHIIELLQCALNGYQTGSIDYENRVRNLVLEHNIDAAQAAIEQLHAVIRKPDKPLNLVLQCVDGVATNYISTNYYREIVYNTEHTIHHLALIKVSLIAQNLDLVSGGFGMARSTIQYKASIAVEA